MRIKEIIAKEVYSPTAAACDIADDTSGSVK